MRNLFESALCILLLTSCTRPTTRIGAIETVYEKDCVDYTDTFIPECLELKCFYKRRKIGQYPWDDYVVSKTPVEDERCQDD